MKQIILLIVLTNILLYSCNDNGVQGSPDATMTSFVEKMKTQDFVGAKEFTNNATDGTMEFLSIRVQMLKEMKKENEIPALFGGIDFSQVKLEPCTVADKKATCKCCEEVTGNCKEISVVQEGGKWLINMPKENPAE